MSVVQVQKIHEDAIMPSFAHEGDACADVYAVGLDEPGCVLWPGRTTVVSTGLRFAIPNGWEIQVRSRSGLAAKNGLFVLNSPGTIDSGYRGELKIILHNASQESFMLRNGMRIAQITARQVPRVAFVEVEMLDDNTSRGAGGFGSTGLK